MRKERERLRLWRHTFEDALKACLVHGDEPDVAAGKAKRAAELAERMVDDRMEAFEKERCTLEALMAGFVPDAVR